MSLSYRFTLPKKEPSQLNGIRGFSLSIGVSRTVVSRVLSDGAKAFSSAERPTQIFGLT